MKNDKKTLMFSVTRKTLEGIKKLYEEGGLDRYDKKVSKIYKTLTCLAMELNADNVDKKYVNKQLIVLKHTDVSEHPYIEHGIESLINIYNNIEEEGL